MATLNNKSFLASLGNVRDISTNIHDLLVAGSLKHGGSWGGVACRAHVSLTRHALESSFWMLVCYVTFHLFSLGKRLRDLQAIAKIELDRPTNTNTTRIIDKFLATIHFAMYCQLIYYKWNFSSFINLIQPCHVILLLEGVALASNGPLGVMITAIILPALSGTFLALLFPDTTGLDQPFEELSYWIQHYLIILVPIYLLQRFNGLALKLCSGYTIGMGVWILGVLHFSFYEIVDLILSVNVEFMLCPTGAMTSMFSLVPPWVLFPSYRSIITLLVFIIGPTISFGYIAAAKSGLYLKSLIFTERKISINISIKKKN